MDETHHEEAINILHNRTGPVEFATIVERFIHRLPGCDGGVSCEERALALAEHFECAQATVRNWASGEANPHPRLRAQVIEFICQYLERTAELGGTR